MNAKNAASGAGAMQKMLDFIERVGNKVPHPVVIFLALTGLVMVMSHVLYMFGVSVTYDALNLQTHTLEPTTVAVRSLLTGDGIRFILTSMIRNFMGFGPVGIILVAMIGVGLAEEAGLMKALIHKTVMVAPSRAIDVHPRLRGGAVEHRHRRRLPGADPPGRRRLPRPRPAPAARAWPRPTPGVAAVFTANVLIAPLDGILTEITNDAIHLLDPTKSLDITANFYFSVVSTFVLAIAVTFISEQIVEPRLGPYHGDLEAAPGKSVALSSSEQKGLRYAFWSTVALLAVMALLTLPSGAPLRHADTGALIGNSPLMDSLIVLIMLAFLVSGVAYGIGAGTMTSLVAAINAIVKTFAGLSGLIFLFLVMSQFIAYFNYSNMATITAVNMADWLKAANFPTLALLVGFVVVIFLLDIILTGGIPKWAIFAPIFVPLFMQLGVGPELVLAAYRVGDCAREPADADDAVLPDDRGVRPEVRQERRRRDHRLADAAVHGRGVRGVDAPAGGLVPARDPARSRLGPERQAPTEKVIRDGKQHGSVVSPGDRPEGFLAAAGHHRAGANPDGLQRQRHAGLDRADRRRPGRLGHRRRHRAGGVFALCGGVRHARRKDRQARSASGWCFRSRVVVHGLAMAMMALSSDAEHDELCAQALRRPCRGRAGADAGRADRGQLPRPAAGAGAGHCWPARRPSPACWPSSSPAGWAPR